MADDDEKKETAEKASEKHEHVWQTMVTGDGSAAVETTRCSICLKEKGD